MQITKNTIKDLCSHLYKNVYYYLYQRIHCTIANNTIGHFRFPISGFPIRPPPPSALRNLEIRRILKFRTPELINVRVNFRISEFQNFFFLKCLVYLDPRTREKYKRNKWWVIGPLTHPWLIWILTYIIFIYWLN